MAEAGTNPPPKTRSNSSMPLLVRGNGASCVRRSLIGMVLPRIPPMLPFFGPADMPLSSTMVFQSPQPSQRPDHLVVTLPQAVQEYDAVFFAMPLSAKA